MTVVVKKNLPHARVPYDGISNQQLRECVMKLNDNVVSMKKEVAALQDAVTELQRR